MTTQKNNSLKTVSPPLVVGPAETDNKTVWLLSFGGFNPTKEECIELTEEQCWWLEDMIMRIDPNLFERARKMEQNPT